MTRRVSFSHANFGSCGTASQDFFGLTGAAKPPAWHTWLGYGLSYAFPLIMGPERDKIKCPRSPFPHNHNDVSTTFIITTTSSVPTTVIHRPTVVIPGQNGDVSLPVGGGRATYLLPICRRPPLLCCAWVIRAHARRDRACAQDDAYGCVSAE